MNTTGEAMRWRLVESFLRSPSSLVGETVFPNSLRQPGHPVPSRNWYPQHLESFPCPPSLWPKLILTLWGFLFPGRPISAAALDVGYLVLRSLCVLFIKTILHPISLCGESFYKQVLLYLISRGIIYILTKTQTTLLLFERESQRLKYINILY